MTAPMLLGGRTLLAILAASMCLAGCRRTEDAQTNSSPSAAAAGDAAPPSSLAMGGAKSVTRFFVTSRGVGRGGDLGGLAGADAHCQALATAEGSGDHTWRAYLSTTARPGQPAVNARDRIGQGPWYNSGGILIASDLQQLHGPGSGISKENAVTERLDEVNGAGDTPNVHDMLTGSQPDGTAFTGSDDRTCGNWTSSRGGRAQVGHHDRMGQGDGASSWNSAHLSDGCSQEELQRTGGAGLFYCFAID